VGDRKDRDLARETWGKEAAVEGGGGGVSRGGRDIHMGGKDGSKGFSGPGVFKGRRVVMGQGTYMSWGFSIYGIQMWLWGC
jgi:hypothetical protein